MGKKTQVGATKRRVFLLSPANLSGRRAGYLLSPRSKFELATRVGGEGAPLGEVFSFVSGLYFRGKLAYARAFAEEEFESVHVITAARGLMSPLARIVHDDLRAMADVKIHHENLLYRSPLVRDAAKLAAELDEDDEVVLLGSIATPKYLEPLSEVLGARLRVPAEFIGRGDMSRGALMLRAVREMKQLEYVAATLVAVKTTKAKKPRAKMAKSRKAAS
ncbi:MAG: hypothetical protein ABSC71_00110 [Candidatus Acidiferrales bacterium]